MNNNNTDTFESTINNRQTYNENFFTEQSFSKNKLQSTFSENNRRLNDLDSNILEEDAYKDVDSNSFKIEYKMSKIETEIKEIENRIQTARAIHDFNMVGELTKNKKNLIDEYQNLSQIYDEINLSNKITGKVENFFGFNNSLKYTQKGLKFIYKTLVSKLPKRFSFVLELKDNLNKLTSISKCVDELMSMQIPFGEDLDKYTQLSKYIVKANAIQYEISNQINQKDKK